VQWQGHEGADLKKEIKGKRKGGESKTRRRERDRERELGSIQIYIVCVCEEGGGTTILLSLSLVE